jgi:hypothetical protein
MFPIFCLNIAYSLFSIPTFVQLAPPTHCTPHLYEQVDAEWLANRKYGGPSKEEMALLAIPDPLISLQLHHSPQPCMVGDRLLPREGVREYAFNSDFGLSYTSDNLTPAYQCTVNVDQVFGRFDFPNSPAEQAMREEFDRELVLELTSI